MMIDAGQIQDLLKTALPECEISVSGEGGKFQVFAIGDAFSGLNPVKRQQQVYQILNPHIASGAIHAVSMRLLTVQEKAAQA